MAKKDRGSSNRRKFLIGAGSVVAGASAVFGTAATTTFNLNDRTVTANVVADASGAVQLRDQESGGEINVTNNELEIDLEQGTASGVNKGSVTTVGGFDGLDSNGGDNDPAFDITNQTTEAVDLDVEFVAGTKFNAVSGGSVLTFRFANVTKGNATKDLVVSNANGQSSDGETSILTFSGNNGPAEVASGDTLDVAIEIDADGSSSSPNEDLSGVLNITATQPS